MSRIGKLLKGLGEVGEEVLKFFRRGEKQEAAVVGDAAKASTKPKVTIEEAREYSAQQAAKNAAHNAAIVDVGNTLDALTPGRFGRAELDARLKALRDKATEHGLIDGLMQSDRSAKKIEEALLKGEKVSNKEMSTLQKSKQGAFEDYEAKATQQAIKNQRAATKANGEQSALWGVMKWPATVLLSTATVGGVVTAIDQTIFNGRGREALTQKVENASITTKRDNEAIKQEEFASRQKACLPQGGVYGEISQQCIKATFSDNFSYLSEVFAHQTTEPARIYVQKLGENLDRALEQSNNDPEKFATAAEQARLKSVEEISQQYKGKLPNFAAIDKDVSRAMGWNAP